MADEESGCPSNGGMPDYFLLDNVADSCLTAVITTIQIQMKE